MNTDCFLERKKEKTKMNSSAVICYRLSYYGEWSYEVTKVKFTEMPDIFASLMFLNV